MKSATALYNRSRERRHTKTTWGRTVANESGKKTFGEMRTDANNSFRWRLYVPDIIWRKSKYSGQFQQLIQGILVTVKIRLLITSNQIHSFTTRKHQKY
jgi:hypothetical protein